MNNINQPSQNSEPKNKVQTFDVQTQHGMIKIPVPENWSEYAESERERIKETIGLDADKSEKGFKNLVADINELGLTTKDFTGFTSIEEAKKASDGVLVMAGDWGGQTYLTCPMKYINCSKETLERLLGEIDHEEWDCNEGDGASCWSARMNPGEGVTGGMGGGIVKKRLWIHGAIRSKGLKPIINAVLSGELESINLNCHKTVAEFEEIMRKWNFKRQVAKDLGLKPGTLDRNAIGKMNKKAAMALTTIKSPLEQEPSKPELLKIERPKTIQDDDLYCLIKEINLFEPSYAEKIYCPLLRKHLFALHLITKKLSEEITYIDDQVNKSFH